MSDSAILEPTGSEHFVQFYDRTDFLVEAVGQFLGAGLRAGDACLVIARESYRDALEESLTAGGLDLDRARQEKQYLALDAAETMSGFMVGGLPDERRFFEVVRGALHGLVAKGQPAQVRIFGEMVALLWSEGNRRAAIRLEELWGDLGKDHSFSLICAYPMKDFGGEADGEPFLEICARHSRVIPAESYAALTEPEERLRAIAELQQKANALEAEVAQRKEAEKALSQREKELSDFLENAAEGLHQVGPDGRILWANQAELDLLGYTAEEYVGRHLSEFHADGEATKEILDKLLRGETLYDYPVRLRCKDGSIKHVLIHSNARWEDGKFAHTRCFTRDVTERVRLEEELQRRVEELAEGDRRKDEFLAMLGHELRNPLAPIVTMLELMRRQPGEPSVVTRSLEVIERQTLRMTRLVNDLLDLSRITRGRIELHEERVDLTTLVERAVEQARPMLEERGHRLTVDLPAEPVTLRADPARLEQVLANLLLNAAKYTDVGGRISLGARREENEVVFSVRDNGIGLTPEFRERIFDLFVQSPGSASRAHGGLGVGLTLVRRLVELHGGSVEARSDGPGRGSEFLVRLPLRVPPAAARRSDPLEKKAVSPSRQRRILVVDDNVDAGDGLADLLRALGHEVQAVKDGAAAIDEAGRLRPEVVFLDIGMPGIDGHEVARRLRAEAGVPSPLLVAVTGFGRECDRRLSREAGFDHHLAKPVDIGSLESLLKNPL